MVIGKWQHNIYYDYLRRPADGYVIELRKGFSLNFAPYTRSRDPEGIAVGFLVGSYGAHLTQILRLSPNDAQRFGGEFHPPFMLDRMFSIVRSFERTF